MPNTHKGLIPASYGVELECYVLEDEQRVFTVESLYSLLWTDLDYMIAEIENIEVPALPEWIACRVSDDVVRSIQNPVKFENCEGLACLGVPAKTVESILVAVAQGA